MDFNLTLIGQTVAMIVFVWFCMKFIWPVLMNVIEERRKNIADGIAAGEKGQKELADARHGSEAILTDARQKAVQVVDIAHRRSTNWWARPRTSRSGERAHRDGGAWRGRKREDACARCAAQGSRGARARRRHEGARPRGRRQGARAAPRRAGRGTREAGAGPWLIAPPSQGLTRGRPSPTRRKRTTLAGWSKPAGRRCNGCRRSARLAPDRQPACHGRGARGTPGRVVEAGCGRGREELPARARGEPPARVAAADRGAVRDSCAPKSRAWSTSK